MKKNLTGCFAIAAALVAFAFTPAKRAVVNCQPNTQYVWYVIPTTVTLACMQPTVPINPVNIVIADHHATSSGSVTPLSDLDAAGYKLTEAGFLSTYNYCDRISNELCAVAYLQSDVTTAKFEKIADINSPSGFSWRPKSQANGGPTPACYICRS